MTKLTARQQEVLELITQHIQDNGAPPTRAEIAKKLGFRSVNAAEDHLRALARKGVIEILPGLSRGIRIRQIQGLPIIGHITAGLPLLSDAHIEGRVSLEGVFPIKVDYLLKIHGSALHDFGILDGDLLAVHRTHQINNGQLAVVRLNNEVLVKRYERVAQTIRLLSAHGDTPPITIDLNHQSVDIEGIGVGILRVGMHLTSHS